jgi:uroporphyrinogen decarboxylase
VKTREDWQQVKGRILPDRHVFGEHYSEQISKHVDNPDVNCIFICGIYAFQRLLMGEENLAYAYFDMPDVLLDMAWHWLELYTAICSRIIRDSRVDFILFHEDMAYKTGPLIGPDLFRQFMSPFYRDLIRQMKGLNVQNFMIDCDGNIDILLPMFYELGINMMGPFEQAAGNDILEIGRKFPDLVMWGGIDKRVLNMTKSEIEKEILEKVPVMYKRGGFIASIDHSTQPCPMENFVYYLELLRKVWESL